MFGCRENPWCQIRTNKIQFQILELVFEMEGKQLR